MIPKPTHAHKCTHITRIVNRLHVSATYVPIFRRRISKDRYSKYFRFSKCWWEFFIDINGPGVDTTSNRNE